MTDPPRPAGQRKVDAIARLTRDLTDVWVATASTDGDAARPISCRSAWRGSTTNVC